MAQNANGCIPVWQSGKSLRAEFGSKTCRGCDCGRNEQQGRRVRKSMFQRTSASARTGSRKAVTPAFPPAWNCTGLAIPLLLHQQGDAPVAAVSLSGRWAESPCDRTKWRLALTANPGRDSGSLPLLLPGRSVRQSGEHRPSVRFRHASDEGEEEPGADYR